MKKIDFVVAGVGFGDIVLLIEELVKKNNNFNFLGFVDDNKKKKSFKLGKYKVLGPWNLLKKKNFYVFNSVFKDYETRFLSQKKLKSYNAKFINLIDPSVNISFTKLGIGIAIFKNVFIGTNTKIGSHSIIHTSAFIGHDVSIGNNCFIASGARILGGAKIGNGVVIGANAVCLPKSEIKNKTIVGACSTVGGKISTGSTMFAGLAKKIL